MSEQKDRVTPIIIASENGRQGAERAMQLLRSGGSALDAVEAACRVVEDDPNEHSVGFGGLPNVVGEVELDASIMDGRTLQTGAVAGVRGYGNPISLARHVLDELPHVLLVGHGAEQLAGELGIARADQRSDEALRRWRERLDEYAIAPGELANLRHAATRLTRPLDLQDMIAKPGHVDSLGTVNFLALDAHGNLASAVSTSGLGWKYPGRVGDSPLIGAGNYCDNRYGAVACTGMGELAIRVSTARSLILYMKMGLSLDEAGLETLADLDGLQAGPGQYMNIVALTPDGRHAGFTTVPGKRYLYLSAEMETAQLAARTLLPGVES